MKYVVFLIHADGKGYSVNFDECNIKSHLNYYLKGRSLFFTIVFYKKYE